MLNRERDQLIQASNAYSDAVMGSYDATRIQQARQDLSNAQQAYRDALADEARVLLRIQTSSRWICILEDRND